MSHPHDTDPHASLLAAKDAKIAALKYDLEGCSASLEVRRNAFSDELKFRQAAEAKVAQLASQVAALKSREEAFLAYEKNRDDEVAKLRAHIVALRFALTKLVNTLHARPDMNALIGFKERSEINEALAFLNTPQTPAAHAGQAYLTDEQLRYMRDGFPSHSYEYRMAAELIAARAADG